VKVAAVFKRLRGPVLADPVIAVGPEYRGARRARELIPAQIPDVFEGDQIVLLGQYTGDAPLDFTLHGNYRGVPRLFHFALPLDGATTRNGFVPGSGRAARSACSWTRSASKGHDGRRLDRGQGDRQPEDPRAGRRDRPALDRVRHPHRVHRVPGQGGHQLLGEGQGPLRGEGLFRSRAIQTRSGLSSVNQDLNNQFQKGVASVNPRNKYLDASMNEVATAMVQQVCDLAFYKRRDRWVDSRLVSNSDEVRPERIIDFGSEEYRGLASRLAGEGRQGASPSAATSSCSWTAGRS